MCRSDRRPWYRSHRTVLARRGKSTAPHRRRVRHCAPRLRFGCRSRPTAHRAILSMSCTFRRPYDRRPDRTHPSHHAHIRAALPADTMRWWRGLKCRGHWDAQSRPSIGSELSTRTLTRFQRVASGSESSGLPCHPRGSPTRGGFPRVRRDMRSARYCARASWANVSPVSDSQRATPI